MIKVYNTKEVADILKVKPLTIRQYILEKKLKAKPLGRTYVITEDELKKFLGIEVTTANDK